MKKNIKLITPVILFFLLIFISCSESKKHEEREAGKSYQLMLLHTNDHHGTLLSDSGHGGLAERSAFIKIIREKYSQVLLLDAGDINTGGAVSKMFHAEPDIIAYNMMGYDAAVFGNHEFDNSYKIIKQQISKADFPFLSANIKLGSKYLGNTPYIIKNYKGMRVGIFGITTLLTRTISNPPKELKFIDEIEAAKKIVPFLKEKKKADIIIALTHMGNIRESESHATVQELATIVPGIDIIVDGHSHSFIAEPILVNNTFIITANKWGRFVGKGLLTVVDGKIRSFEWEPVAINTKSKQIYKPDPEIILMLQSYIDKANIVMKEVIGEASDNFIYGDKLNRYKETELGDIICDSNIWYIKKILKQNIDFAFHNSGNIRAGLSRGPITQEDIVTMLPYESPLFIVSMKGDNIIKLFDFIAKIKQGSGGWAQVSKEVSYIIDYSSGAGSIKNLTIGGKPVNKDKIYKFCTNSFLINGGDGYELLGKVEIEYNIKHSLQDIFIEYLKQYNKPIVPKTDGRIQIIGK